MLKSYFDCDTIETHGMALGEDVLHQVAEAKKKRGVIVFTDPDHPGETIRRIINQAVPGCKNAYIEKKKARTVKKVGVEHASRKDIEDALAHLFTYQEDVQESISKEAFIELGLNGGAGSAQKRAKIAEVLYLGKPNAKTLFKRLNMLGITREEVEEMLEGSGWKSA